jgi:hypothetical protein
MRGGAASEPAPSSWGLRLHGFRSVRAIAVQLNERGILTPRGGAGHLNVCRSVARTVASGKLNANMNVSS